MIRLLISCAIKAAVLTIVLHEGPTYWTTGLLITIIYVLLFQCQSQSREIAELNNQLNGYAHYYSVNDVYCFWTNTEDEILNRTV